MVDGGRKMRLTERTRNASFKLEVERGGALWISSILKNFSTNPSSGLNFSKFRGVNELLSTHRFVNKRGSFLERNKRIFDDEQESIDQVWDKIRFRVAFWSRKNSIFKNFSMLDISRDWKLITV